MSLTPAPHLLCRFYQKSSVLLCGASLSSARGSLRYGAPLAVLVRGRAKQMHIALQTTPPYFCYCWHTTGTTGLCLILLAFDCYYWQERKMQRRKKQCREVHIGTVRSPIALNHYPYYGIAPFLKGL